jgi:hypothetical protein
LDTRTIVSELKRERDRLDGAIAAITDEKAVGGAKEEDFLSAKP